MGGLGYFGLVMVSCCFLLNFYLSLSLSLIHHSINHYMANTIDIELVNRYHILYHKLCNIYNEYNNNIMNMHKEVNRDITRNYNYL
jgi:hypothetical protein